jgi:hypothetical protein
VEVNEEIEVKLDIVAAPPLIRRGTDSRFSILLLLNLLLLVNEARRSASRVAAPQKLLMQQNSVYFSHENATLKAQNGKQYVEVLTSISVLSKVAVNSDPKFLFSSCFCLCSVRGAKKGYLYDMFVALSADEFNSDTSIMNTHRNKHPGIQHLIRIVTS